MTRDHRLQIELDLLRTAFTNIEVGPETRWVVIPEIPLPAGWNVGDTWLLIEIPSGYPTTPPDNFYTRPDIRLASGRLPGSTQGPKQHMGRDCLMFSYHLNGEWEPAADPRRGHNITTFVDAAVRRLQEVN